MRPISPRRQFSALLFAVLLMASCLGAASAQGDAAAAAAAAAAERHPVPIYFFWGQGCPYCDQQKVFLTALIADHPNAVVYDFEVYQVMENRTLMAAMAAAFGRPVTGVPMTFIGDETWTGYSAAIGRQMRDSVERYGAYAAPDPVDRVEAELRPLFLAGAPDAEP